MSEFESTSIDLDETSAGLAISRRAFLKTAGGGIAVFFLLEGEGEGAGKKRTAPPGKDFNAYLRIAPDGSVTCFAGRVEMGQGIVTSLAQMLAEELDVSLDSVDMVMGDTKLCPFTGPTWGSTSTPRLGEPILRAAGATARVILMELAAEQLGVPAARLVAVEGVVYDRQNKQKRVTYGELAQGKEITQQAKLDVTTKKKSAFKIIGKGVLHRDGRGKVTGKAMYAGDIRIENMAYARILRPPAHGARLKKLDTSAVDKMEGFQVVRDGDLVAVLHTYPDEAEKALEKLDADYDLPKAQYDDKTVFDYLMNKAGKQNTAWKAGNLEEGKKLAQHTIEHTYLNGYVSHASIETHAAVARFDGDEVTVWASTQAPFLLQEQIADQLNIPLEKLRVIAPFLGGGFGGKASNNLQAIQAVRIAKLGQRPVQVAWSRADEFFYDAFRHAGAVKIRSGIDASGKMLWWDSSLYGLWRRGAEMIYTVPHHRTAFCMNKANGDPMHALKTGPWRAPFANTNTFAKESHIDAMAAQAGMDPLEFRLKNLSDQRMKRVLKKGAEKFGWTQAKTPSGRGFGIACGYDVGVPVAVFAEVKVNERTGRVQVKRVVCALDLGLVVNPQGARIQAEGGITMGLGYALTEEMRFNGGRVNSMSFHSYELPRFSWVPKIETVLLETDPDNPLGGGEPAIICMGGVIANAIYDATGARVLHMPMTLRRVKQALAAKKAATS